MQTVEQWMSQKPRTCTSRDPLDGVARVMWEHDCGVVPVVDAEAKLVGMVTDRDLCMAAWTRGCALHELVVETAMTKKVASCRASDTLADAARAMKKARVRRLPVLDRADKLVGILSINDLVRAWATHERGGIEADTLAESLSEICAPRGGLVKRETPAIEPRVPVGAS